MNEKDIWAEDLPEFCPPPDAIAPNYQVYYRLVTKLPVEVGDFYSSRSQFPLKEYNVPECIALSTSIWSDRLACQNLLKNNVHRGKHLIEIMLPPESGLIKKTGQNDHHYSWWRKNSFDPVPHCKVITVETN